MKHLSPVLMGIVLLLSVACKKNNDPQAENLGTFNGKLTAIVETPAQSGDLLNADVSVSKLGNTVTVNVKAAPNFDRSYTGDVNTAIQGAYIITLKEQSKPTKKIVGGQIAISGNILTFDVTTNGDAVEAIKDNRTVTLTGNVNIVGTNLVRK